MRGRGAQRGTHMALGKHQHTKHTGFRRERSDSKAKNLAQDYPEFRKVHGSATLGTLKERFDVNALNKVGEKPKNL